MFPSLHLLDPLISLPCSCSLCTTTRFSDLEVWIIEQFIEIFGVPHTDIHCPSVMLWTMKSTWGGACTNARWLYMAFIRDITKVYNCAVFQTSQTTGNFLFFLRNQPLAISAIGSTVLSIFGWSDTLPILRRALHILGRCSHNDFGQLLFIFSYWAHVCRSFSVH